MTPRLRIGFLTPWRTDDEAAWSGIIAPMQRALGEVADVVPISTHDVRAATVDRAAARAFGTVTRSTYLWDFGLLTALKRGRAAGERVADADVDVVFAVAASVDIAFLTAWEGPVVQYVDATFEGVRDRYPVFANLSRLSAMQIGVIGRRADRRTSRFVAASQWARDRLARDHAIGTEVCSVAPPGPAVIPSVVLERPATGALRALVVSTDWARKGGDAAVRAVERARAQGADVELTVVGECPDTVPEWVTRRRRLAKSEMSAEYARADVLIELAVANAAGVTLTDAAAHGLPAIATATMGVPSIVSEGRSGWLVEPGEHAHERAAEILVDFATRADRTTVFTDVRHWYDQELAWDAWACRVMNACAQALAAGPRVGATS